MNKTWYSFLPRGLGDQVIYVVDLKLPVQITMADHLYGMILGLDCTIQKGAIGWHRLENMIHYLHKGIMGKMLKCKDKALGSVV